MAACDTAVLRAKEERGGLKNRHADLARSRIWLPYLGPEVLFVVTIVDAKHSPIRYLQTGLLLGKGPRPLPQPLGGIRIVSARHKEERHAAEVTRLWGRWRAMREHDQGSASGADHGSTPQIWPPPSGGLATVSGMARVPSKRPAVARHGLCRSCVVDLVPIPATARTSSFH